MFRIIRSYYLSLYYKIAEKNKKNGKPDKAEAFLMLSLFFMPLKLLYLFLVLSHLSESFRFYFRLLNSYNFLSYHKGDVTGVIIACISLGIIFTYLFCCFKINYVDIPKYLAAKSKLIDLSFARLALIPFVFILISVPIIF